MSKISEIERCIKILIKFGTKKKNIILLHCNSAYPTPAEDVNLKTIGLLKKKFKLETGLSDHSSEILTPIISIAFGSKVIEKHFTLNKKMIGPDHKSSLNPKEFKTMVEGIRYAEKILGKEKKIVTESERTNIKYVRKSIVSKITIKREKNLLLQI